MFDNDVCERQSSNAAVFHCGCLATMWNCPMQHCGCGICERVVDDDLKRLSQRRSQLMSALDNIDKPPKGGVAPKGNTAPKKKLHRKRQHILHRKGRLDPKETLHRLHRKGRRTQKASHMLQRHRERRPKLCMMRRQRN